MEKECPHCHGEFKVDKFVNEITIIMSCKHCRRIFKITYVFIFWHLWGFWNGMPILSCFGFLPRFITNTFYPLFIIDIAISLYQGLCENKRSWQKKDWSSTTNSEINQKIWHTAGITVLCLFTVIGFLYGVCSTNSTLKS